MEGFGGGLGSSTLLAITASSFRDMEFLNFVLADFMNPSTNILCNDDLVIIGHDPARHTTVFVASNTTTSNLQP